MELFVASAVSGWNVARLETRTKESSYIASGQVENLERVMKVKVNMVYCGMKGASRSWQYRPAMKPSGIVCA